MHYSIKHTLTLVLCVLFISNTTMAQTEQVYYQQIVLTETLPNKKVTTTKLENAAARNFDFTNFISKNLSKKEFTIRGLVQSGSGRTYTNFNSKDFTDSEDCTNFCEQIESIEKQPYLGVGVVAIEDFEGVMVETVINNSAAEKAGFKAGDIITYVEEFEIRSGCDLTMAIRQHAIGEQLSIRYIRDEDTETKDAILGHRLKTMISFVPCCDDNNVVTEKDDEINIADESVVVFPNPSYGVSQMIFKSSTIDVVTMTITDMSGKEIVRKNYGQFDGYLNESIDLTDYPQGMYFMTIYQKEKVFNEKIILQRP